MVLAAALGLSLSGCTNTPLVPDPPGTQQATPSAGQPAETAEPVPSLRPELSAAENLAYFDFIAAAVLKADPNAGGRDFIDALAAGGFDKTQMEVTFDRTAVDLAADSIQFAVRFNGECLIGQNGPASDGYHSIVAPLLGTDRCLLGATRQIDW